MRISILLILILSLTLTACGVSTPQPFYPTLAPTPDLDAATDFVSGENRIPAEKYPFIEIWNTTTGYSSRGECPGAAMIDFPAYFFTNGELDLFAGLVNLDASKDMIGFIGFGDSNEGAMGGGIASSLHVIQQLPFEMGGNSIQSILEDGTLALQVSDGQVYWLYPGQARIEYSEYDPDAECHVIVVSRLTNFGLLDGENINLAGTPLAPSKTPTP